MSEAYLSGVSRDQQMLLPDSVEQFVSEGNVARVIDVLVGAEYEIFSHNPLTTSLTVRGLIP